MTTEKVLELTGYYNKALEDLYTIYNILTDFFTVERVDLINVKSVEDLLARNSEYYGLQEVVNFLNANIHFIIHFPEVTITNEQNQSVDCKNFWVKIPMMLELRNDVINTFLVTSFYITRSEYPMSHLRADYMHSHCPGVPWESNPWKNCCLGNGPIRRTVATLASSFSEDVWNLFCFELNSYIKTESITGGPYRRMSYINGENRDLSTATNFYLESLCNMSLNEDQRNLVKDFFSYFIENYQIPFNYINGTYGIAMSYHDFTLYVSKAFYTWFNNENNPYNRDFGLSGILTFLVTKVINKNNKFYHPANSTNRSGYSDTDILALMEGKHLFDFKGAPVTVRISNLIESLDPSFYIINSTVLGNFVAKLLQIINLRYGKSAEKFKYPSRMLRKI